MPLPKLTVKTTVVVLPISQKSVLIKPMTVAQQIDMMEAQEKADATKQITVLKNILSGCVSSEDVKFKVGKLLYAEAEYLLLKIRAVSGSDTTEDVKFPGATGVDTFSLTDDVSIVGESRPGYVDIGGEVPMKIMFTLPTLEMVERQTALNGNLSQTEQSFGLILSCVENVCDQLTVNVVGKDITEKELREFIGCFTGTMFEPVTRYFAAIPQVCVTVSGRKLLGLGNIFVAINAAKKSE